MIESFQCWNLCYNLDNKIWELVSYNEPSETGLTFPQVVEHFFINIIINTEVEVENIKTISQKQKLTLKFTKLTHDLISETWFQWKQDRELPDNNIVPDRSQPTDNNMNTGLQILGHIH